MSTDEISRVFDQMREQSRLLGEQGVLLATIAQSQKDTHERLFGNGSTPGAIPHLYAEVATHSKQITFWKGALAVLTVLWTAAVALATVAMGHHK